MDMSMRSALEGEAKLLHSELLDMVVVDSMQGFMLRIGSFLEKANAALGRLSIATTPELSSLVVPDVCLADESGVDFYGRFSPTAMASMTPVLHIMPELQELCGEHVLPLSVEQVKVDSLEISVVHSPPSQAIDFEESGDVDCVASPSPECIGHVAPIGDVVATSRALAHVPEAIVAKEICD
jgi:hypothetical protein